MKILVAGASGALGRPLITQLRHAGHEVWGMAQSPRGVEVVGALGAGVVQGNALDRAAVFAIMERLRPDCVVDQLTSLPASPFDLPHRLPADRVLRLQGGAICLMRHRPVAWRGIFSSPVVFTLMEPEGWRTIRPCSKLQRRAIWAKVRACMPHWKSAL